MYRSYYDADTYLAMIREFEAIANEIGFVMYTEQGGTVASLINEWLTATGE